MDPKQQQPQQSVQQQPTSVPQPVQQPQQPVGGRAKEMMPQSSNEWVAPSTPEIVLPKEVQAAGVEAKPLIPTIPPSAQQAGVQHMKEATPVPTVKEEPIGMKTPRSVLQHLKAAHRKVSDSFSWLVRMVLKEQDKKEKGANL